MKFTRAFGAICAFPTIAAFAPSVAFNRHSITAIYIGNDPNVQFGGNTWKPDSETMGSTDTGDFFPEDYEPGVDFTEGMAGSQSQGGHDGPQLPGMENLGDDAVMMGGIEAASDVPEGTEFVPSSVPDKEIQMNVASSSKGTELPLEVPPVCMTFEDFYVGFSKESHPSFRVTPTTGRMDRRGGELTELSVFCEPQGRSGTFVGDLVILLPEDNSKICYKITATCF